MTSHRRGGGVSMDLPLVVGLAGISFLAAVGCSGGSPTPFGKAADSGPPVDGTVATGGSSMNGTGGSGTGGSGGGSEGAAGSRGTGGASTGGGGRGDNGGGAAGHGGTSGAGAKGETSMGGGGGRPGTGGTISTGGTRATGGVSGTGGAPATGGIRGTGGAPATGGTSGTGGATDCSTTSAGPAGPHAARSSGYAGTLTSYSDLYNVVCTTLQDCATTCVAAGGTQDSCTMGSECISGAVATEPKHCLPPTYWRYESQALAESADWTEAAEQTLVVIAYQDPIVLSDFRLNVPAGATIRGIQLDVRRSADALKAVDHSIRVLRNGVPVGTDHKKTETWPMNLAYVTYGGPTDLWGTTWTAADVQGSGFGISVAAKYTDTAGNARAYVDYVSAKVFYTAAGCP